jgi:putative ABC transport system substrate-binding protein
MSALVDADPYFDTRKGKLVALAARYAVPTMFQFREYTVAGGLMSHEIDSSDVYRHVGDYAGQILKGAKPSDLGQPRDCPGARRFHLAQSAFSN